MKINLAEKFAVFETHWDPKIIGELNGQHVKLVRMLGPFAWHSHQNEDELFMVFSGHLTLEFRDHREEIGPGEMIIVPRGTEHRPVAVEETTALIFEPASTLNTGDADSDLRVDHPEWI